MSMKIPKQSTTQPNKKTNNPSPSSSSTTATASPFSSSSSAEDTRLKQFKIMLELDKNVLKTVLEKKIAANEHILVNDFAEFFIQEPWKEFQKFVTMSREYGISEEKPPEYEQKHTDIFIMVDKFLFILDIINKDILYKKDYLISFFDVLSRIQYNPIFRNVFVEKARKNTSDGQSSFFSIYNVSVYKEIGLYIYYINKLFCHIDIYKMDGKILSYMEANLKNELMEKSKELEKTYDNISPSGKKIFTNHIELLKFDMLFIYYCFSKIEKNNPNLFLFLCEKMKGVFLKYQDYKIMKDILYNDIKIDDTQDEFNELESLFYQMMAISSIKPDIYFEGETNFETIYKYFLSFKKQDDINIQILLTQYSRIESEFIQIKTKFIAMKISAEGTKDSSPPPIEKEIAQEDTPPKQSKKKKHKEKIDFTKDLPSKENQIEKDILKTKIESPITEPFKDQQPITEPPQEEESPKYITPETENLRQKETSISNAPFTEAQQEKKEENIPPLEEHKEDNISSAKDDPSTQGKIEETAILEIPTEEGTAAKKHDKGKQKEKSKEVISHLTKKPSVVPDSTKSHDEISILLPESNQSKLEKQYKSSLNDSAFQNMWKKYKTNDYTSGGEFKSSLKITYKDDQSTEWIVYELRHSGDKNRIYIAERADQKNRSSTPKEIIKKEVVFLGTSTDADEQNKIINRLKKGSF